MHPLVMMAGGPGHQKMLKRDHTGSWAPAGVGVPIIPRLLDLPSYSYITQAPTRNAGDRTALRINERGGTRFWLVVWTHGHLAQCCGS